MFCERAEIGDEEDTNPLIAEPGVNMESSEDEDAMDEGSTNIGTKWTSLNDRNSSEVRLTGENQLKVTENEEDAKRSSLTSEFLNIHYRSGHMSFRKLQVMAKQGAIPRRFATSPIPVCTACMYGRATKRRWRDKPSKSPRDKQEQQPGDKVSVDQMVSPTPGLIAQMTGILTTKRYKYTTVYIDQASKMGFTYLQKTASAEETLQSKRAFEAFAANRGVTIKSYHADNGIFRANEWMEDCKRMRQPMTFAGVAAHHQNGQAERRIRMLQEMARTMLVHGNKRWKEAITIQLWPYALRMANSMINEAPNMQDPRRRSPEQIFTKSEVQSNPKHWHTFGCPVYILNSDLQTGKPYHKWRERSRIGIYIGRSPHHARNVALVLDRETGLVSPQFHVSYDSSFDSLKEGPIGSSWQLKAGFISREHNHRINDDKKRHGLGQSKTESRTQREAKRARMEIEAVQERIQMSNKERDQRLERRNAIKQAGNDHTTRPLSVGNTQDHGERSNGTDESVKADTMTEHQEIFAYEALVPHGQREVEEQDDPLALKAVADPDTMYWHQAMREPDSELFKEAMEKEIHDQQANGNFTIVHRSAIPSGKRVFPAVWQMRRKRDIRTQEVKKYKARMNLDGSRMKQGLDYEETYAPVTSWRSIRMLLTMVAMHKWHTLQLDYVLAFP